MNTRGRKKQSGTSQVPAGLTESPTVSAESLAVPVAKKQTRKKTKVSASRKSRVVVTPVKKKIPVKKRLVVRGPKTKTAPVSDGESESPQVLEDQGTFHHESPSLKTSRNQKLRDLEKSWPN